MRKDSALDSTASSSAAGGEAAPGSLATEAALQGMPSTTAVATCNDAGQQDFATVNESAKSTTSETAAAAAAAASSSTTAASSSSTAGQAEKAKRCLDLA